MNKQNYFQKEGEVNSAKCCSAKECSKDRNHTFRTHAFRTDASYSLLLFSCSVVSNSVTPQTAARQDSLSFTVSRSLIKLMSMDSVMPSNHLVLCHLLFLLPSIFPSIRVFSNELPLHTRWPKYWSFGFSISPSNEQSGLISFRIDWFDLLAVQRTLRGFSLQSKGQVQVTCTTDKIYCSDKKGLYYRKLKNKWEMKTSTQ